MKNKKGLILVLALVVIIAAGCGIYVFSHPADINDRTPSATAGTEAAIVTTLPEETAPTEPQPEETVTEEATVEETTEEKSYDFLKTGVWYLYNDDKTAYAFTFTGKDRAEIAYFDQNNTSGLDAKYYTTSADYEINEVEDEVILEIDDPIHENESFMFALHDNAVYSGKDKLANEKEVSLDTVFAHYMG